MADTTTPHFALVLIQIGASRDTWGDKLNDNMSRIDTALKDLADGLGGKLNSISFTDANVLAKVKNVDGPGSGLDADLLDGQEASYFTNIVARLGYTPFNKAGGPIDGDVDVKGVLLAQTPNSNGGGIVLRANPVSGGAVMQVTNAAYSIEYGKWSYSPTGVASWYGKLEVGGAKHVDAGVFPYFAAPGMSGGRIYVAPVSGGDPTSQPGDIWLAF